MQAAGLILGITKAVGSFVSGAQQSANLKAQQQANEQSARYERENALNELRMASADAEAQRRSGRRQLASQIAGFSQSGFGLGASAGLSIADSAGEAELDALNVQYKGTLNARSSNVQAINYKTSADNARRSNKLVPVTTTLGAATNILSGYSRG